MEGRRSKKGMKGRKKKDGRQIKTFGTRDEGRGARGNGTVYPTKGQRRWREEGDETRKVTKMELRKLWQWVRSVSIWARRQGRGQERGEETGEGLAWKRQKDKGMK